MDLRKLIFWIIIVLLLAGLATAIFAFFLAGIK